MTRRTRIVLSLLAVTFALTAGACADSTAPQAPVVDHNSPWTDHNSPWTDHNSPWTSKVGCDQNSPWTSC